MKTLLNLFASIGGYSLTDFYSTGGSKELRLEYPECLATVTVTESGVEVFMDSGAKEAIRAAHFANRSP